MSDTQKILARVKDISRDTILRNDQEVHGVTIKVMDLVWLTEAVKELSQALEFYGDPYTWKNDTLPENQKDGKWKSTPIEFDGEWIIVGHGKSKLYCAGKTARTALAKVAGSKE